jgi:septal ring factor EnvC (AmiA/AmiB activator)
MLGILLQDAASGPSQTVWLTILTTIGAATSAVFGYATLTQKQRISDIKEAWAKSDKIYDARLLRCEGREDKLLADAEKNSAVIGDLSTSVLKVAGVAETAVGVGKETLVAIRQNQEKIDESNRAATQLTNIVTEVRRSVADLAYDRGDDPVTRRRPRS